MELGDGNYLSRQVSVIRMGFTGVKEDQGSE